MGYNYHRIWTKEDGRTEAQNKQLQTIQVIFHMYVTMHTEQCPKMFKQSVGINDRTGNLRKLCNDSWDLDTIIVNKHHIRSSFQRPQTRDITSEYDRRIVMFSTERGIQMRTTTHKLGTRTVQQYSELTRKILTW